MLDRTRLTIERKLGTDPVDPNSYFEEGSLLLWGANGWYMSDDGADDVPRAMAGINRLLQPGNDVSIKEPVILNGVLDSPLNHGNIDAASVVVTDITGMTTYATSSDYILTAPNGLIRRAALSTIPDGATVLVTYGYQKTLTEQEEDPGMPLSNNLDETLGVGNMVAIQGDCIVALTNYDPAVAYVAGGPLYDNGDGRLTSVDPAPGAKVGYCKTPPSAGDRFLVAQLSLDTVPITAAP